MCPTSPLPRQDPVRARLEARLTERHAIGTEDFKRVFGKAPGRWLQMEKQHGTLGACQLILRRWGQEPIGGSPS